MFLEERNEADIISLQGWKDQTQELKNTDVPDGSQLTVAFIYSMSSLSSQQLHLLKLTVPGQPLGT